MNLESWLLLVILGVVLAIAIRVNEILKILKSPVIHIVTGIKNSIISRGIFKRLKAAKASVKLCPIVKNVTSQTTFLHWLKL